MPRHSLPALLLALGLLPGAGASETELTICHGFGCQQRTEVAITGRFARSLAAWFQPPAPDAATEREQIARAIAYLERQVGAVTGTDRDIGGNYDPEREQPASSQMDCIDESHNTTRYLRLLDRLGLLRWHRPAARRYRSRFLIDGHWTAVIEEIPNGRQWAVDAWYHDNGQPPEIQPLADWLRRKRPAWRNSAR